MNPNDDELKLDDIQLKEKTKKLDIDKLIFPIINIRRTSHLSESTVSFFALGIGFFIYAMFDLEWFNSNYDESTRTFVYGYYVFVSSVLYADSLYDWYQGRSISLTLNFLLGSLFLYFYLNRDTDTNIDNVKLEGIFYILIFAYLFFVAISMKDKGIIYLIDFLVLFVGMVFQFAVTYWKTSSKINYVAKTRDYIFIVNGALFWLTGVIILLFDVSSCSNKFVEPPI